MSSRWAFRVWVSNAKFAATPSEHGSGVIKEVLRHLLFLPARFVEDLDLDLSLDLIVAIGALGGALASGFAGFAFGAASLSVWAHTLSPSLAVPLVVACSLFVQLMTLPGIWRSIDVKTALPFILGGAVGVPVGASILGVLDPHIFRTVVGIMLMVYVAAVFVAGRLPQLGDRGVVSAAIIGFGGGVMGGFAGLSGILPTIWCSLMKWSKDRQRSTFQIFNLSMHTLTLIVYGLGGGLGADLVRPLLVAVPMMIIGSAVGFAFYRRVDEAQFKSVLLVLLGFAGLTLLIR